jgi:hypothetical protein
MKKSKRTSSLFIAVLIWGIASTCGAAAYYETLQQPAAESAVIKAATEFKVKPIDFSAIKPADLGYSKAEEWKADLEPVPQAFAEAFPILFKETNVSNKKITMLKQGEQVNSGIVVAVAVKSIILKYNYFTAQPDEFICNVTFTDAASSQKLFSGEININSRSGNPWAQAYKASFSNRLQSAAYNIAWVLTKIMSLGKIDPPVY